MAINEDSKVLISCGEVRGPAEVTSAGLFMPSSFRHGPILGMDTGVLAVRHLGRQRVELSSVVSGARNQETLTLQRPCASF